MFFFSRQKKNLKYLVLDISSSSIGALVYEEGAQQKANVLFSVREEIQFGEDLDYKRFVSSTTDTLIQVLKNVDEKRLGKIHQIHCVLASPWCISQNRTVRYQKDEPFAISADLIDGLTKNEVRNFQTEVEKSRAGKIGGDSVLIEVAGTKTTLNGYETDTPIGKRAKELTLDFFISIASKSTLDDFRKAISATYHSTPVVFHSFPLVASSGLRYVHQAVGSGMIVDVNGEITDILIVRNGIVRETISFPLGRNFVIRWLSKKLGSIPGEAGSLLGAYQEGHLDEATKNKLSDLFAYTEQEWSAAFIESLKQSSSGAVLPSKIFLISLPDSEPLFQSFISHIDASILTSTTKSFSVEPVSYTMIESHVTIPKQLTRDPFLLITILFIQSVTTHINDATKSN